MRSAGRVAWSRSNRAPSLNGCWSIPVHPRRAHKYEFGPDGVLPRLARRSGARWQGGCHDEDQKATLREEGLRRRMDAALHAIGARQILQVQQRWHLRAPHHYRTCLRGVTCATARRSRSTTSTSSHRWASSSASTIAQPPVDSGNEHSWRVSFQMLRQVFDI